MNTPAVTVNQMSQLEPVRYDWGAVKWIVNDKVAPGCVQSVGYVFMHPGSTNPEHHHTTSEEVMYMIAGECEVSVGSEKLLLTTGMSAVIPIASSTSSVTPAGSPAFTSPPSPPRCGAPCSRESGSIPPRRSTDAGLMAISG